MKVMILTIKVVKWLSLIVPRDGEPIPFAALEALALSVSRVFETRGVRGGIAYTKSVRSNLMNYLSGNPLRDPKAATYRDGVPKVLGALVPFIRKGDNRAIAYTFTVLMATRALKLGIAPDLSTITQPPLREVPDLGKYVSDFWRALGHRPAVLRKPSSLAPSLRLIRTSNGPNGPALGTAMLDAVAIPSEAMDMFREFSPKIHRRLEYLRDDEIQDWFASTRIVPKKKGRDSFRRLVAIPDKEGKTRIIGILDYYSQACLRPLHSYLARVLARINQDCTADQGKFKELLLNRGVEKFHSVDLTAATDRFPISLIKLLLLWKFPEPYVNAWEKMMVGFPFDYDAVKTSYAVGNPMGAYSSFNSFALAHHYIVYHACRDVGVPWKALPYAMLGDDIVIGDCKVAARYKELISSLGVEFSPMKTHESARFFEFAKRMFYDGEEVSAFPISALIECGKSVYQLTNLLYGVCEKGWSFTDVSAAVALFQGVVNSRSSRQRKAAEERCWLYGHVLRITQGKESAQELVELLLGKLGSPLCVPSVEFCNKLVSVAVAKEFARSSPLRVMRGPVPQLPLWDSSVRLQKSWDKWKDLLVETGDLTQLRNRFSVSDLPTSEAALAVDQMYVRETEMIRNRLRSGGSWHECLKSVAVPTSEKSLVDRASFKAVKATNRLAMAVLAEVTLLVEDPELGVFQIGIDDPADYF